MNRDELVQRTAFSCLARFIYAENDTDEIKRATAYFLDTWCHESKPVPSAPTFEAFMAGFQRWKVGQA